MGVKINGVDLDVLMADMQEKLKTVENMQAIVDLHSAELRDCNEREQRVKALEKKIDFIMGNAPTNFQCWCGNLFDHFTHFENLKKLDEKTN